MKCRNTIPSLVYLVGLWHSPRGDAVRVRQIGTLWSPKRLILLTLFFLIWETMESLVFMYGRGKEWKRLRLRR